MTRFKRTVVHAALILFTVWPAVHIGLVERYDLNPWKLAGWGMYSAPQLACDVRVFCFTPDRVGTYELTTIQPEFDPLLLEFLRRRRSLGELTRPDRFAQSLLDYFPAVDGLSIVVVQPVLNPRSGMIEEKTKAYDYFRRGGE